MLIRFQAGRAVLVLAILLAVGSLAVPFFGLPAAQAAQLVGLLVAGPPEILCLIAVALLGGENYRRLVPGTRASASRWCYYGGLGGCLLNSLPLALYAYAPSILPGSGSRYYILGAADVFFLGSVFLAGGEFWEKFRRLFIWEGNR